MRRPLALILAAGSLAVGVPAAAVAAGGDGDPAERAPAATQPVQQEQEQPRGDRGDCPERDGGGSGDDGTML
jgi:hypothetical protein